jgi:hypothetical protein
VQLKDTISTVKRGGYMLLNEEKMELLKCGVFTKFKVEENLEELWYKLLVSGRVF